MEWGWIEMVGVNRRGTEGEKREQQGVGGAGVK
jgi:hypothetical protein